MSKTFWIKDNTVLMEEPFSYKRLPRKNQYIVIKSKKYSVERCNRMTNGDIHIYIADFKERGK